MIRIGILTFHRSINYGAFMQAYSMSNFLSQNSNFYVEIIDFEPFKKNLIHKFLLIRKAGFNPKLLYFYFRQFCSFRSSLRKFLPVGKSRFRFSGMSKLTSYINQSFDIVIVGSDAVWAYNNFKMGVNNPFWLSDISSFKFSYAASAHSLSFNSVSDFDIDYIKKALSSFFYIGVRDFQTEQFVYKVDDNLVVNRNCDPTFFLTLPPSSYFKRVISRFNIPLNKPVIGLMVANNIVGDFICELFKDDYFIVSLYNFHSKADLFLYDLNPLEWAISFSHFAFCVTDFFHGSLLSLRNLTPTFMFGGRINENLPGKHYQVFKDLDLTEYYFERENINRIDKRDFKDFVNFTLNNLSPFRAKLEESIRLESAKRESFEISLTKAVYHLTDELGIK